jgi:hypothetical protein
MGAIIIAPYVAPSTKSPIYTFYKGANSLLIPELDEDMDLSSVPNKLKLMLSNGEESLVSVAVNDNPLSPVSTVSRRRTKTAFETLSDIAGTTREERQANLDARSIEMLASKSSVVQSVDFSHGYLPIPCDEVIRLDCGEMGITDNFAITARVMDLSASGLIKASVRRFISL